MLEHELVLKSDELFLVGDISADESDGRAAGLYLRDTRHLSHFKVTLNGAQPNQLSVRVHSATSATVTTTNSLLRLADGTTLPPQRIVLEKRIALDTRLHVTIVLQNFSGRTVPLTLGLALDAHFRDIFDIRGFPRERRGTVLQPRVEGRTIVLGYRGLDDLVAETAISFDQDPTIHVMRTAGDPADVAVPLLPGFDAIHLEPAAVQVPGVVATFNVTLQPGERWELRTVVAPRPATGVPISPVPTVLGQVLTDRARIWTDNPFFDRVLERCELDLAALLTSFPEGALPAAGIPWYVAPFGRDSLIVGLQTIHTVPLQAVGTLRTLAALQGKKVDEVRLEEPGKILHEVRYGEMARLGEIPHTPYYGTVDATPLFIWLFAETVAWTTDERLYHDLLPNVRRALEWIERYGDCDGDGFVEYRSDGHGPGQLAHQNWKDSFDSLNHVDGRPATGLIAAVEVQGYVFACYDRLADVVAAYGESDWASELREKAEAIRRRVEEGFWLEPEGFYAQALDGEKEPVRTISSNPGHLLACGLPSPERASRVAARLRHPDMDSGWGIRTLSSAARTYNPMSYHNGSVWPHDNSFIASGLYRYGHTAFAHAITEALFAASESDPLRRLPELYCGFARTAETADAPVAYPVSCNPQAWAAGALPFLVRSMLGLHADIECRCLVVAPTLPDWLNLVVIDDLQFQGRRGRLTVRRDGDSYAVRAEGLPVEVRPSPPTAG